MGDLDEFSLNQNFKSRVLFYFIFLSIYTIVNFIMMTMIWVLIFSQSFIDFKKNKNEYIWLKIRILDKEFDNVY